VTAWVNQRIGIDASLRYTPGRPTHDLVAASVGMQWRLVGGLDSWAYVVGGPAFISNQDGGNVDVGVGGVVGGGAHVRVARRLAIRAEFDGFVTSQRYGTQWDPFLSLGLSIAVAP